MDSLARIRLIVRGAVQGVGFRPFVYRLASELRLSGWVANSSEGVHVEAEGAKASLDDLLIRIGREHPRHASIHSLEYSFVDPIGASGFQIRHSETNGAARTFVLPDIATCADCLSDVFDPENRRYLYPFTNCTNCGPRFTIIERLPYDRENSTMRSFSMCRECRAEYDNPLDRRFHAQPNACPKCGPQLEFWSADGKRIASRHEAMRHAVEALNDGAIVAVKGMGGFHLMADAANDDTIRRLRKRKHREEKPFALMAPSLDDVRTLCFMDALEERALLAPEAPIVILRRKPAAPVAAAVAPENPYLGVMLPYTPLHHILMRETRWPVVATSGNHSDEPIIIDEEEAVHRLGEIADFFLVHDRPIRRHVDDSIVRVILGGQQILRRARGFAPIPIEVKDPIAPTLSAGAHLKNTIALGAGRHVFVSQHIGDLETKEASAAFRQVISDFETLYQVRHEHVAADMHPDYVSTIYASRFAGSIRRVQHHWAHVLACMAENGVEAPALGVAWDGAGYGPDGTIWGGEFLIARPDGFHRAAHLRTFPLPGGDAASRRPSHTAAGLLHEMGMSSLSPCAPLVLQMLEKRIRTPMTSSAGRLFDAVACITGLANEMAYEGQAAMKLEFCAAPGVDDRYEFVIQDGDPFVIDWAPMISRILEDVRAGIGAGIISAKFHNTLAEMIVEIAHRAGERRIVLTGGCFQNRYLTERTVYRLRADGFTPYWHQRIPPNDGGISLGQVIAAQIIREQEKSCVLQYQER